MQNITLEPVNEAEDLDIYVKSAGYHSGNFAIIKVGNKEIINTAGKTCGSKESIEKQMKDVPMDGTTDFQF